MFKDTPNGASSKEKWTKLLLNEDTSISQDAMHGPSYIESVQPHTGYQSVPARQFYHDNITMQSAINYDLENNS